MTRVVFTPSGVETDVPAGTNVLDAARRAGVDLDSVCGGRAVCGRCQVVPVTGSFPKWAVEAGEGSLGPWSGAEADFVARRGPLAPGRRLGCSAVVLADVVVDVPPDSQVHRPVVRKDLALDDLVVDPTVHLAYVEVVVGAGVSAADALDAALAERHPGLGRPGLAVLRALPAALARHRGQVTVAVRDDGRRAPHVAAVWPGYVERVLGVAVDVGSTTIAGHLCDLATGEVLASAGRMNPQIRFGEDLMSRVSYAMLHADGAGELTAAVRAELDELCGALLAGVGAGRDEVLEVLVVGNPVMHHLLLGLDPVPLGQAPFTLAVAEPVRVGAAEVGLGLPWAEVETGPLLAGHVGADTAAAVLAEGPHRGDGTRVLVDVGTNAEIVVGDRRRLWAASSPTGPAFEGAQLSCGQRASVGAVERVRVDPDTLEPRLKVIGCELWSDDPGFDDAIAGLPVAGVCGSGIVEVLAELFLAGVIDADGTIDGAAAGRTARVVPDGRTFAYVLFERGDVRLAVTQNDVRAVQLAKAALRAGVELLLDEAGRPEVVEILLAGAFGAHLDPLRALVLGLVPDAPVARVRAVGNAAGAGAVRALLSRSQREEMAAVARTVTKVETATEPRFQEHFVAAMAFPHAVAPTPWLAAEVALPARRALSRSGGAGGRARRRGSPRAPG